MAETDPSATLRHLARERPSRDALRSLASPPLARAVRTSPELAELFIQATLPQIQTPPQQLDFRDVSAVLKLIAEIATMVPRTVLAPLLAPLAHFTSTDATCADYLQICVCAGHYHYAQRSLKAWALPHSDSRVVAVLRLYFWRGMVYAGAEDWERARLEWLACLSVPAQAVSAIALEAYKKLALIECLRRSPEATFDPWQLPEAVSPCYSRFLGLARVGSAPEDAMHVVEEDGETEGDTWRGLRFYYELTEAFVQRKTLPIAEHESVWRKDSNLGLVRQCQAELVSRKIFHYSRIYSKIALSELAQLLHLDEQKLPALLCQMSGDRSWPVQISEGTVHFPRKPTNHATNAVGDLMALGKVVKKLDQAIESSNEYARAQMDRSKSGSGGPRGVEDV